MKVVRAIRQSLILLAIAGASAAMAGTAAAASSSNLTTTTNNQNSTSSSNSDAVTSHSSNVQVVGGQGKADTAVTQVTQSVDTPATADVTTADHPAAGTATASDVTDQPAADASNQPASDSATALPAAQETTKTDAAAAVKAPATVSQLSLPVYHRSPVWYAISKTTAPSAIPATVAAVGTVPSLNTAAAAPHPKPATPSGLLTSVTDLLDSLILPVQLLVGAVASGLAVSLAWPMVLQLVLVAFLICVGYVAWLRRSGFATAPRGSDTYYFVTSYTYELCPAVIRTG